jgi:hypothetical protein
MKKFLILYKTPVSVMEAWMSKPAEETKAEQEKMKADWDKWMTEHGANIAETLGAGKTKSVSSTGVSDIKNDVMLYSIVNAESHEEAAKLFEGHPHLSVPGSTIEIMTANTLTHFQECLNSL